MQKTMLSDERFPDGVDFDANGHCKGLYVFEDGVVAPFSLRQQKSGEYAVRGRVSLLSPEDGYVMQKRGRAKREANEARVEKGRKPFDGEHPDAGAIRASVYAHTTDPEEIKKKIADAANKLYNDNIHTLADSSQRIVLLDDCTLLLVVHTYSDKYIAKRTKSDNMRKEYLRMLHKVARELGRVPIRKISQRMLNDFGGEWGEKKRKYIKEMARFLDFVMAKKHSHNMENPFSIYLEKECRPRRNTSKLQQDAVRTDVLAEAEERKVNREILDNIDRGEYIGLMLMKEAGLTAQAACQINWSDINLPDTEPDVAYVRYRRDDLAGATHDYSFPIVGFGARVLRQRWAWVMAQVPAGAKIENRPVITEANSTVKRLSSKTLMTCCRRVMKGLGVGYAQMIGRKAGQNGAGARMLNNTYKHRLESICGLSDSNAVVKFLQHIQLSNSVLADHYRALTDETGRWFLTTALRRDRRFVDNPQRKRNVRRERVDETEVTHIAPQDARYPTQATIKANLRDGEELVISAPHGLRISAEPSSV